jgi:hypothetical protein
VQHSQIFGNLAWSLCAALLFATAQGSAADRPKETILSTPSHLQSPGSSLSSPLSLYPVRFGSPRRDSYQAALSHAKGQIEWTQALPRGALARTLLVWDAHIAVEAADAALLFSAQGQHLWTRPKRGTTPLAIAGAKLFLVNQVLNLEAVDVQNKLVLADNNLSALASAAFDLQLLWPQEADFVASAYMADPRYDEEARDRPKPSPKLLADRSVYGKIMPAWHLQIKGEMSLPPLYNPERGEWMAAHEQVRIVNVNNGRQLASFKQPVEEPLAWSVDKGGNICIIGNSQDRKLATALGGQGEALWTWADPEEGDPWVKGQAPMRGNAGRVYLLTQGRLLAIDGGKLAWTYDARSESLQHGALVQDGSFEVRDGRLISTEKLRHGTVLADNSVLITGRKTLRHIDAMGHRIFSLNLPEEIITPPVVDAAGAIYVAGTTALYKVR